ncbi:unnamed protein product [Peronospora belbahrii]|uniref:Uncharacterized protein n=1 Tax=Peronospora belbahrii TaxID=622444 RepID=A0ABN8D140_9STRA|nr:unnamed protein product [Peronospora belbahrii]
METVDSAREEEDVEMWKAALDEDAFDKLSETDISYATTHVSTSMNLEPSQRQEQSSTHRLRIGATTRQRFKRKNFSKQLQLLCLQRYAQYARDYGHLPVKYETQQILQQSYLQFLKEGGTADEPRLTHAEFLKLIRNRRREINVRLQCPSKQNKDEHVTVRKMAALTPAKRKLQEEHAKIQELMEVIDRAREQTGSTLDLGRQERRLRSQQAAVKPSHAQQHQQQLPTTVAPSTTNNVPSLRMPSDSIGPMEAILQIHLETREVQREIVARLRSISRIISQHESHGDIETPPSASV